MYETIIYLAKSFAIITNEHCLTVQSSSLTIYLAVLLL